MVEWSISLQPQEELAAFARFGNAVASLCVEKKGARACLKNHFRNLQAPLCGIFYPHSVAVARYAALIRIKIPRTGTCSSRNDYRTGLNTTQDEVTFPFRSGKMASVSSRSKDQIKKKWNSASICNDSCHAGMEEKSRIMLRLNIRLTRASKASAGLKFCPAEAFFLLTWKQNTTG